MKPPKRKYKQGPYVTLEVYAYQEEKKPIRYVLSSSGWNRSRLCGTHSPLSERDVLNLFRSYMKESVKNLRTRNY
jgi:hypothetical protein